MNFNMNFPRLNGCTITNVEERAEIVTIQVEMEPKTHNCPKCGLKTNKASATTIVRRFDKLAEAQIKSVEALPPIIAIDEYKGDTSEGKYQLIIADGITKQPLDILPNRYGKTIKQYLQKHGHLVEVVVMDMSYSFKKAVQSALGKPVIVADRFHFSRYIYWH